MLRRDSEADKTNIAVVVLVVAQFAYLLGVGGKRHTLRRRKFIDMRNRDALRAFSAVLAPGIALPSAGIHRAIRI